MGTWMREASQATNPVTEDDWELGPLYLLPNHLPKGAKGMDALKLDRYDNYLDCDVITRELTRRDYLRTSIRLTGTNDNDTGPEPYSVYRQIGSKRQGQCLAVTLEQFEYMLAVGHIREASPNVWVSVHPRG